MLTPRRIKVPGLDRVFNDSAAMRVGISFRDAGPGVAAYPVTTAGGAGVQRGRTQAVTESTYTIAVTEIKPSRHAVYGVYSIEDNARLPGMSRRNRTRHEGGNRCQR